MAGHSGAWTFIRDFAAHWDGTALGGSGGCTQAELDSAELRLGLRLPTALREAYLLFGRRRDLTSNHDALLDPANLYVDDAKEALVFRHENQGAASWGILLHSLQNDDPAVLVRLDLADKRAERWEDCLRDDDGMAVPARGRTAEDLDRVRDLIPGDRLNDHR